MDFQLKQWNTDLNSPKETQSEKLKNRHHQSYLPPAKIPKFLHDQSEVDTAAETETETAAFKSNDHNDQGTKTTTAALPLFVAEVEELNPSSSSSSKLTTTTNFPGSATCYSDSTSRFGYGDGGVGSVVVGGGYFSLAQWQELELQAVIYRHMAAGATVPPELLQLVKRSLIANSPSLYLRNYTYYHQQPPPLMQTGMMGYWGSKASAMDAEPGRCRRTDGKKWRCSRDVVVGQKYCERHVHRGRNRSRKPVEFPPPPSPLSTASTGTDPVGFASDVIDGGSGLFRASSGFAGGGEACFSLSGSVSGSFNGAGQLNKRKFLSENEPTVGLSDAKKSSNGQVLRHFFDDWPGSATHNDTNHAPPPPPPGTCLSISTPGLNPSTSSSLDFLKLSTGTGGGDERRAVELQTSHLQRQQQQLMMSQQQVNWNRMGGPLGEALRSSTGSGSSPTSVLHPHPQQLPRSVSETSYVSA